MRRFEGGNDTFKSSKSRESIQCLLIANSRKPGPAALLKGGEFRPDAWIVETRGH